MLLFYFYCVFRYTYLTSCLACCMQVYIYPCYHFSYNGMVYISYINGMLYCLYVLFTIVPRDATVLKKISTKISDFILQSSKCERRTNTVISYRCIVTVAHIPWHIHSLRNRTTYTLIEHFSW